MVTQTEQGARVTQEIRSPMGWLMGRMYRLAKLLEIPEVQDLVQQVVIHLDNYCTVEEVDPQELEGHVLPTRNFKYITIHIGARECYNCHGTTLKPGSQTEKCETCRGTGIR